MRSVGLCAAVFAVAVPLFAGGLQVWPSEITLRVGDTAILHAENVPGGLSGGFPYSATFSSDKPSVAGVEGFASGSGYLKPDPLPRNGDVFVKALAPGVAHVRASGFLSSFATITVAPPLVVTVVNGTPVVVRGQSATLAAALSEPQNDAVFAWYVGHTGDTSRLLQSSSDPVVQLVPDGGVTNIWVNATAGRWQASAETEITVTEARRRSARH